MWPPDDDGFGLSDRDDLPADATVRRTFQDLEEAQFYADLPGLRELVAQDMAWIVETDDGYYEVWVGDITP